MGNSAGTLLEGYGLLYFHNFSEVYRITLPNATVKVQQRHYKVNMSKQVVVSYWFVGIRTKHPLGHFLGWIDDGTYRKCRHYKRE